MNQNDKDPFAKYDKLFDEQDRKSVVQPTSHRHRPKPEQPQNANQNDQKKKAYSVVFTVFFFILSIQFLPLLIRNVNFFKVFPIFSFVLIVIVINMLIKAFKR